MNKHSLIAPADKTKCIAVRHTRYAYDKDIEIKECGKPATYRIDGNTYCTVHAGQAALSILINETTLRK